jgi:hypothetical protein
LKIEKTSAILLLSWLSTGLERAGELQVKAMSTILAAAKIEQSPAGPDRAFAASKTALHAFNHHITQHFARDIRGRRRPTITSARATLAASAGKF